MSHPQLPLLCNVCGKPSTSCACSHTGRSYPSWPQGTQFHTPQRIRALKTKLARSASWVLAGPDPAPDTSNSYSSNAASIPRPQTEVEIRAEEQLADEKDRLAVAEELQRYISEGVLDDEDLESFSLTQYWGVSWISHCFLSKTISYLFIFVKGNKNRYPMMYHVVLDVLPAQASLVACERVFSSSKETITMCRSCLSPVLMEILQFLKYTYWQECLDLIEGFVSLEKEILKADIPSIAMEEVRKLLTNGQIDQLIDILDTRMPNHVLSTLVLQNRCWRFRKKVITSVESCFI